MRVDERLADELRDVRLEANYMKHAEGSVLISVGDTKVLCAASVEEKVPPFLRGQGKGWVTAEYAMLPRATEQRNIRESTRGKVGGRTMEIQRLIGRALRSVVDMEKLGERTLFVDCDVLQADGGTRTASITGAFVAMVIALHQLQQSNKLANIPVSDAIAATSVGVLTSGESILDLCYDEDCGAAVDMNVVMTGSGEFVEIQGTGEEQTFSRQQLDEMLSYAEKGIGELIELQRHTLENVGVDLTFLPRNTNE